MRKRVISITLAGVMLFSIGFVAEIRKPTGFLPFKSSIARAETIGITINGMT